MRFYPQNSRVKYTMNVYQVKTRFNLYSRIWYKIEYEKMI